MGNVVSTEVLLFSDLHAHPHKRKPERLRDCLRALEWVFETARRRNISDILFGGDLLHDRYKIDVYSYQALYHTLRNNLKGVNLWLLLGNHDLWYNQDTSVSSVTPFASLPGVRVVDQPSRHTIGGHVWDFIPFTHDPLESLKSLGPGGEYCLAHVAIDGALLHGTTQSDVVVEHDGDMVRVGADIFSGYRGVFLGHYHAAQKLSDAVEYVGSPLELSFGEAGQAKHLIALDQPSGGKTYIENDFSPKHFILRQEELAARDLRGHFVQLVVDDISAADLIQTRRDVAENSGAATLEVRRRVRPAEDQPVRDAKAILFQEGELLVRYVDEVGTDGLDREELLRVGREICEAAA